MASTQDYFKLHFIVFLWGFSAILGKLAAVPAIELVFFRSIFAAAGMALVIYIAKGDFRVERQDLYKMLAIGSIVALHWLSFFGSARVSNVSVSLVGFATNSLWAALLEPLFKRTKIKKYEVLLGVVVLIGLYIIVGGADVIFKDRPFRGGIGGTIRHIFFSSDFPYKTGLLLGILAGFTSALFSLFNAKLVNTVSPRAITFYEMIGVFAAITIFIPFYNFSVADAEKLTLTPSAMDLLYIAILAGVCSVYAYTVATELMKRISVFMIQLSLNLEPIYGIIMAVIIFGSDEKMDTNFYIGTAVILCAVAAYPLMKKRFDKTVLID